MSKDTSEPWDTWLLLGAARLLCWAPGEHVICACTTDSCATGEHSFIPWAAAAGSPDRPSFACAVAELMMVEVGLLCLTATSDTVAVAGPHLTISP
jgi:hypothetical protein